MEFKIESNIPLPAARQTAVATAIKQLSIGDSFLADPALSPASFNYYAAKAGIKLAFRKANGQTVKAESGAFPNSYSIQPQLLGHLNRVGIKPKASWLFCYKT